MSNILIIKHGSLGDLIQANGAIEDIKNSFKDSKVLLLTSKSYSELMYQCPYIDGVIVDKRLPRWNLFYLASLRRLLNKYNFSHVFDLQNSSRTRFYKKYILSSAIWSSSETSLEPGQKKMNFDEEPVLNRFETQLEKSGVEIIKLRNMDLSWTFVDMNDVIKAYKGEKYILIFPFCSKKHIKKKWPYFKELIKKIDEYYKNKYSLMIAPGPSEINESSTFGARVILDKDKNFLNLNQLITLINNSSFIISNDTGPAHISSHLKKRGLVLFGSHTTASKVSIENENFKAVSVKDLKQLSVDDVFSKVKNALN